MKLIWKSAAAALIAVSSLTAVATPAQALDSRYGWRGDRYHDGRWDRRHGRDRWDRRDWRRQHYRNNHHYWRGDRRRCWTEWRYDRWRHRDVRVRICR